MSYTTSLTYVAGELVQSVDFYLGDPDRPIMPCAQDHPTMQDIIDSVRNTVDNHGNSIYQAVAVPVRNLPHDIQAIFERGGALDWVERSIDQVVFSHNIATGYRTEGMQPGVTWSSGAAPANEWNKEFKVLFSGKRTILITIPPGAPEPWRLTIPDGDVPSAPSFTPEELAATCSLIVHETTHVVDAENISRNTPHDNPLRVKRFYDRILGPEQYIKTADYERRAVDSQILFSQEVYADTDQPQLRELPNTVESWQRISTGLSQLDVLSETYAQQAQDQVNPINRLDARATYLASQIERGIQTAVNDAAEFLLGIEQPSRPAPPDFFETFRLMGFKPSPEQRGPGDGPLASPSSQADRVAVVHASAHPPLPTLGLGDR